MKQSRPTSVKLRSLLIVIAIILLVLSVGGFYFGQDWLRTFAGTVSQKIADSQASGTDVQSFKKLQADLEARKAIIAKANSIVASSQNYQDQTIRDLTKYANYANISITNYDFAQAATTAATPTSPAQSAATGSSSVTISIASPISYTKLMKFMSAIESNTPKMQISSVNLGRAPDGNSDSVKTDKLTIEVYTR
ncbi:MAG: hypothetical protein ABI716_01580 [Candidatus Saccharibacteria bacterium]